MRQQLEAAEQDPSLGFCISPGRSEGDSPVSPTARQQQSHRSVPGAALSTCRTPGASTSALNEIKLLQRFCLVSSQPHISLAPATLIPLANDPRHLPSSPKSCSLRSPVERGGSSSSHGSTSPMQSKAAHSPVPLCINIQPRKASLSPRQVHPANHGAPVTAWLEQLS